MERRGLTEEEERRVLTATAVDGLRSMAIVLFLLRTGLRVGEAVQIDREEVLIEGKCRLAFELAPAKAKGGQGGLVSVAEDARRAVEAYCRMSEAACGSSTEASPLFLNERGRGRVTVRNVQRLMRRVGAMAKVPTLTPHVLRHTLATRMVRVAPLTTVAKALRHLDVRTTQGYVSTAPQDVQDAVEAAALEARQERLPFGGRGRG